MSPTRESVNGPWDVRWPQVVKRTIEVPKMAEQILDVLVPDTVEQLVKLPKTISEDKIQERTARGMADIPVPQVVKGLEKVSRVFSQDKIEQRYGRRDHKNPWCFTRREDH